MKNKILIFFPVVLVFGILMMANGITRVSAAFPTPTRTRTPTRIAQTATRTKTPTAPIPTPTITPTPLTGAVCSPLTATITAPFIFETVGGPTSNEFCWRISALSSINSFETDILTVNGVNFLNQWVPVGSLPPQIGGYWYIHFVAINKFSQHFDAQP